MGIVDVQNLKRFRAIKDQYSLDPEQSLNLEKKIWEKIKNPKKDLLKRLQGLEMEDEFLLLLLMVTKIEQITKLDQNQIINRKKYTVPDFLLSVLVPKWKNSKEPLAQRMFVEVKKCKDNENEFHITQEAYTKLRHFCELYSKPLYFAIKFNTPSIKHWFFIPGKAIEKFGKLVERKIHNRNQKCFIFPIEEALKRDMSGLWLNNHIAFLKKDTIIEKIYDSSVKDAFMIDNELGAIITHKIQFNKSKIEKNLVKGDKAADLISFSIILKKLTQGKLKTKKDGTKTTLTFTADSNYFVPYYHIVLETYLYIRRQYGASRGDQSESIEYYLSNFSDLDWNLITVIKNIYFELANNGLIVPVSMMPSTEE